MKPRSIQFISVPTLTKRPRQLEFFRFGICYPWFAFGFGYLKPWLEGQNKTFHRTLRHLPFYQHDGWRLCDRIPESHCSVKMLKNLFFCPATSAFAILQ